MAASLICLKEINKRSVSSCFVLSPPMKQSSGKMPVQNR